jgi:hypothetical protein
LRSILPSTAITTVAEVLFWGNLIRDPSNPDFEWILDSEDATISTTPGSSSTGSRGLGTVVDIFLEEAAAGLTPAEREFLERLSHASLRLYEVESVRPGEGVHSSISGPRRGCS